MTLSDERIGALVAAARAAMSHACCAFSGFPVGAALLAVDGSVHLGVNVESSSSGGSICAERSALVAALSTGARRFVAIAIATTADVPTMPCGMCRQLLHDYAPGLIVIAASDADTRLRSLAELLPEPFGAADLIRASRR